MYAKWIVEDGRFSFSETDNGGVQITDARHAALFDDVTKVITADANGLPVAVSRESLMSLAQVQDAQISDLYDAYAAAIAQPVSFTSKAGVVKTYQADPDSANKLGQMLLAYLGAQATPAGFYWLSADNTQVPFSYADLQGLAADMGAQGFAAFAHLQTLKAEVRAATTAAAVSAIVW